MFRLNFWAQSIMGPAGLSFSDARYGCMSTVPPVLPPPPMSMLYTSPAPVGLVLPESLYRRPVIDMSGECDSVTTEPARISSLSVSSHSAADYPSLLLHSQLEALRRYQQQRHHQAADCSTATVTSPSISCDTSAFSQPPPRRHRTTPDHLTPVSTPSSPVQPQTCTDDDTSPARKTGTLDYCMIYKHFT